MGGIDVRTRTLEGENGYHGQPVHLKSNTKGRHGKSRTRKTTLALRSLTIAQHMRGKSATYDKYGAREEKKVLKG